MIKTLKLFSWIGISCSVLMFIILVLSGVYQDTDVTNPFFVGARDAICEKMIGKTHNISSEEISYAVGYYILPYALSYLFLLLALQSRERTLYIISTTLFVFLTLGQIGRGHFPLVILILSILLFTKPVREYFKKKTLSK